MRRTTIALEEDLLRELKLKAAKDGVTLGALVNRMLRRGLRQPRRGAFKFHLTTCTGPLRKGVDLDDTAALLDVMDDRG